MKYKLGEWFWSFMWRCCNCFERQGGWWEGDIEAAELSCIRCGTIHTIIQGNIFEITGQRETYG